MDLTDLAQLKALLQKHSLWAKHSLGQNFLVSRKSLERIVRAAELSEDDLVLEVGPGPGVLTLELLPKVKKVIAVELDREIIPVLTETTISYRNLEVRREDILKFVPPSENYKVVANIPYYLTSKLLRHFLEEVEHKPSMMVMLAQKEVAEKILSKKNNLLALSVRVYAQAEIMAAIPAGHFYPIPKVDSVVLRLRLYDKPAIKSDPKTFFKLARAAFIGKRKQLKNTVSNLGIPAEEIKKALLELGHTEQARPEELSLEDWDKLVRNLSF
ncbi:MAG: 16S rRNA (adenine(1518)-N(6)/adenine(1519)-N(6))-dimethyltransferase RsmA [Candidatus Gracilibacteria bacterium]|nr:16S rRNA (adenine(1518)-N(6)/adenine(1519)-N(6))-dimethyltransferase RsmA [Candidatus Gracilibacteria bacterium]